jgi:hypothetical protein
MLKTSSMKIKKTTLFSKSLFVLGLMLATITTSAQKENRFKLDPSTNMLMTGKGPGQDGSINPFAGQDCVAVVENLAKAPFSVRIQQNGVVLKTIEIGAKETKQIDLKGSEELYIDTQQKTTRFTINYKQPSKS